MDYEELCLSVCEIARKAGGFIATERKHFNPDKIEKDLMQIIPQPEWFEFTYRLIDFGRTYCPARFHDHKRCLDLLHLR